MRHYGIEMQGDFIGEIVATPPVWASSDEGRLIYAQDINTFYYGSDTEWVAVGSGADLTVVAKTSNYSLVAADMSRKIFANIGAGGNIELSLPAGVNDYETWFYVAAAHYLRVNAQGTDVFRYGSGVSSAAGFVRSNVVGTLWRVIFIGGSYVVTNLNGLLKYDI
jgi:hypothetical protein